MMCNAMRLLTPVFSLVALVLSSGLPLQAQGSGTGSVQGVVADQSGATIPGAAIEARNVGTGVTATRQASQTGNFTISPLVPGEYTVTASSAGFQTTTQQHVVVDALSQITVNLTLQVGNASEKVTVDAAPPPLNTSDACMGQTLRNEVYNALPLAMGNAPRDPTSFTTLLPGVSTSSQTGNTAGNALGSQDHSGEIYIEGLPATNPSAAGETRTLGLGVSVEAVDQFQLETAGTAAMYSGQGSANFVVKSGTNQFHGAAFEYFRNTVLDARGFFAPQRPPEHQNEFGFNFGGPIKRNKLFFFTNYDGFRFIQQTQPSFVSIPTLAQRGGNFSALSTPIYDPASTVCGPTGGNCMRTAFAGNIIPTNRISPISQNLQSFLPTPSNNALQNNYLQSQSVGFNNDSTTNKVDYTLNEKNSFYFLFSRGHRYQTTPYRGTNTLPLPYATTYIVDEYALTTQAKWTYVATPTIVNQLSYGLSRFNVPITNATIEGNYATNAGLTGLPAGEAASAFPEIAWSGPNAPDGWRGTSARAFNDAQNTFSLQDNVQWTHGKHSFTFGGQMQWLQANEKARTYGSLATWSFSNNQTAGFRNGVLQTTTGNPYASYLLGTVNQASIIQDSVVGTGGRYKDVSWWVQDTWRIHPKLTLSLGLRHDIWTPYVEVANRQSFFNPSLPNAAAGNAPGILQFYGSGPNSCDCNTNIDTKFANLGPRVGIAFSPNEKTVVRAGYSIMYSHRGAVGGRGGGRVGLDFIGYSASPVFQGPNDGYSPAFNWNNGVPGYQQPPIFDPTFGTGFNGTGATPSALNYGDSQIGGQPPRYQNWNFAIERSFLKDYSLGVAYVGSNGHYLGGGGRGIWSDQIDPKYLALGNLLQQQATPTTLAAANRILPGISLPYANFTGSLSQMLRPFPQYANINDLWGDVGNSNYNSFQVYGNKRMASGLTFNFNYTFARAFDDTGSNTVAAQTFTARSAYNWGVQKAVSQLPRHTVNVLAVYKLPFGKEGTYLKDNGMLSYIVGNWQLSTIVTYRSGLPMGNIGAACNLPNAGGCYANYNPNFNGPVRINGPWGSGNLIGGTTPSFLDRNAFASPAAYTYGDTPRTGVYGLENPGTYNADISLRREFPIRESIKLAFQVDSFNAFNVVNFSAPATNITSANFGKISSQANRPRVFQLNARITF